MARHALFALLTTYAAALTGGGVWLLVLQGSPFFAVSGLLAAGVAVLLYLRPLVATGLHLLALLCSVVWTAIEAGPDPWAFVPRAGLPCVLGLLLPFASATRWRTRAALLALPLLLLAILSLALFVATPVGHPMRFPPTSMPTSAGAGDDWRVWGADAAGTRYSRLGDVTPDNVRQLQVAWTYRVGLAPDGRYGNLEVTPLKIGDRLFLCNNMSMVDALNPDTGERLWRFDPHAEIAEVQNRTCRGVAYAETPASSACPQRIVAAALDGRLWALNAATGVPCTDFGQGGSADLTRAMGDISHGYYYVTSAPVIARGTIVVGGWITDGQKSDSPPGVVRGFDLLTGAFKWAWDSGRPDQRTEPTGSGTYTRGSPNSWAPMSADDALGLIFVPTGNAAPDHFGANRSRDFDAFSSAVVALDAESGNVSWSFQTVHHDLWDYDVASQPTLIDLPTSSGSLPALIQPTKTGQLFVLDRRNGRPLVVVDEQPVKQDGAAGERLAPTQPFSTGMPSLVGPALSERRMWGLTPLDQLWCAITFRRSRYDGVFTPPRLDRPTLQLPGFMGGVSWGSASVDPSRMLLLVNSNRIPTIHQLLTRQQADGLGLKPTGTPGAAAVPGHWPQEGAAYAARGAGFLSPLGVPCSAPPYGVLTAVSLTTRTVAWERPLGTSRDSGPLGLKTLLPLPMGVPNLGGALVTAGGLAFISATQEETLRAIDTDDGTVLWQARLPAGGQATPMTYRSSSSGRQFIIVAAGGHGQLRTRRGDYVIAYALPGRR